MRLLIDLQACHSSSQWSAAVDLVQALHAGAGAHQVLAALHADGSGRLIALRAALCQVLPAAQVQSYLAPPAGSTWQERVAHLLRDTFVADQQPDLVLIPGLCADGAFWLGSSALRPAVPIMLGFAEAPMAPFSAAQSALLRQAALLLSPTAQCSEALAAAAPGVALVELAPGGAAAARIWEHCAALLAEGGRVTTGAAPARARLAYFSPLPPAKSGIAFYSLELLAELERHYDIELIVERELALDSALSQRYPVRSVAWFEQHRSHFDRLLYHVGNSLMHKHMFALLRRNPGVVVLHDFFLSNALQEVECSGYEYQAFLRALYESHGYAGLEYNLEAGRNAAIWKYPCNRGVIEHATGVIVHSEYARYLADHWYGEGTAAPWRTLPMIRGHGDVVMRQGMEAARQAARLALGYPDGAFVICSFGLLGTTKLNERLLDAFLASSLAANPRCRLVFVGENPPIQSGHDLARAIKRSTAAARITISGFVSAELYNSYLCAADAAVQLRQQSRGETSASVLDCLLHAIPTIVNAHGSSAALPDHTLLKLDDDFTTADLSGALERLFHDPALRARLAENGAKFVAAEHAPAHVGQVFYDAIEHFEQNSANLRYRQLLAAIERIPAATPPEQQVMAQVALAISANRCQNGPRQLFIDVSALVQTDLRTGIQRVVRSILLALLRNPPLGYRIEPIFGAIGLDGYRYARTFTLGMIGDAELQTMNAPLEAHPGDLFLGLDLFAHVTAQNRAQLCTMRERGVGIHFVLYDVLPLLLPQAFPYGTDQPFGDYVDTISAVADGIVCISRSVADELADCIEARKVARPAALRLGYFHLGADINASVPTSGLPDNTEQILQSIRARPTLLMVGTMEPRKRHAQALAALELLWEQGVDLNLVIVGKKGWLVDETAKRLQSHPLRDTKLFWLRSVSDEMLIKLYENSAVLLAASIGEGFGLPLIEAAQHGLPLIARDLPVFREVAGDNAFYFKGDRPDQLASAIDAWLALHRDGLAPQSGSMPWLTWAASAQQLVDVVCHDNWYQILP